MPKSKDTNYPEIDEIREDLNSLKDNVVELTKHIQKDSVFCAEDMTAKAKKRLSKLQTRSEESVKKIEGHVRENPAQSVAVAFIGGLVTSLLCVDGARFMHALMPILEQVVVNRLISNKAPFTNKNKIGLAFAIISGLLFFTAAAFIIIAGYAWLLSVYTMPEAALITAIVILILAFLTVLASYLAFKKRPSLRAEKNDDMTQITSLLYEAINEEWAAPIQEKPKTALLLASIGGFIAGDYLQ